jgi:hypothetical protein
MFLNHILMSKALSTFLKIEFVTSSSASLRLYRVASAWITPNCEEINTLKNPITDAELSFIEFMASVFNERISYLLRLFSFEILYEAISH